MNTMTSSYVFIVNPISGRGAGRESVPELERLAKNLDLDYRLAMTERAGHAINLARGAARDGAQVVVAVGGDGTANEVLNGLMEARQSGNADTAMGVIGVGRGNDFAYGAGVPAGLEAGFKNLVEGQPHVIDIGKVTGGQYPQGRYFGNGVGIGFDAVVGFEALKLKYLHGFPNYMVAALKTMFLYYTAPLVEVVLDNEKITMPALMVSIMNGRRMGGGFLMAPDSQNADGQFDLCLVEQVSRMGILGLIPKFMKGTQVNHPKIRMCRSRIVRVRALVGKLPAHADGETLCTAGDALTIEMLHSSLPVVRAGEKQA
jgi:YegS/Rv2252/BmrU family lipid kinase